MFCSVISASLKPVHENRGVGFKPAPNVMRTSQPTLRGNGLKVLLAAVILLFSETLFAQIAGGWDESKLYAESKQVNQFFRRFNGEEDEKGKRFYQGDKQYRSDKLRKKYLGILFDEDNAGISASLKSDFVKNILDNNQSAILDFHKEGWFSEVQATFTVNGRDEAITLFMELEKDHLGYKWVISKVQAGIFEPYFVRDTSRVGRFLHPMSHELDFMNLRKAFANTDSVSQFAAKRFVPDHLSIFLYELKKGSLKFKSVQQVRFHFFQISGWYFQISEFNRPGYNTGWLISNLVRLNNEEEKNLLKRYLYK
jgi:hypothetical protein